MKKYFTRYTSYLLLLLLAAAASSCKKEYTNPGQATGGDVLTSASGLTDLAIGLQYNYTVARTSLVYNTITGSGLLTNELYVVNAGNTDEAQLGTGGGAVQNTNSLITGTWTVANKVIYDANSILNNVNVVTDKGYASGLVAYASIFKALAIGDMAMFWNNIPDTVGKNVSFISATAGFNKAVAVLDNAIATVNANAISSAFTANIPAGIDIVNTLYALKARYALFAGNYPVALAAANNVNLAVKSTFNYNSTTLNPIFQVATSTNNVYQVVDSAMGLPVGLQPDPNDKREPFYIAISSSPRFRIAGFGAASTQAIPVYLPGEIMLIKAECYAQQPDIPNGLAQLNLVVTKQPAADPFGVGAGLPPTTTTGQADLLQQIYKHRCIELFMSGLKLIDNKRFNRPVAERKRTYYPFPFVERNDNTNTPADPAF